MDDDEDDYAFFGTPLPEIEEEAVLRKKAAKELEVRDEKGRQRFHGAFTGGFSAGYFNTVGTKEGWAPSTFISSRSKISDRIQQNPEDFMDDEDFGEFGIATRKIHTTSKFQDASDPSSRKRKHIDTDTVIPGDAPLKDIVQPVRESIGIIILNKLGWRQGQGIGPRVKKQNSTMKIYGCSPFPVSVVPDEEDDPMSSAFTFAPKDTEGLTYQPKDNYFGLGYSGLSKQSVLHSAFDPMAPTSTKSWLAKEKKKIAISGQAFGVGAFEDDDEDIYGKDDMSQYDFSDLTLPDTKETRKTVESSKEGGFQTVIEGFHLASQPPLVKNHYLPPVLPPNFKPVHLKSVSSISQVGSINKSRHALTASDRSLILGEKQFHKAPSVTAEKHSSSESTQSSVATSSLHFQPFPKDSSKQKRYEEYLKLKQTGDVDKLKQPRFMTEWEKQQEIEEFSKASVLFKPLSNVLSSRFESRSHLSVEHEVMAALEKLKKNEEKTAPVKKSLVGTSNRTTIEWHPASLLCKRMNVPNPFPNSNSSGTQCTSKAKSVFDHLSFTEEKPKTSEKTDTHSQSVDLQSNDETQSTPKTSEDSSVNIKQVPESTLSKSLNKFPSENKRPPMDFFKDIFDNSSSEDEENLVEDKNNSLIKLNSEKELPSLIDADDNVEVDADDNVEVDAESTEKPSEAEQLSQGRPNDNSKTASSSTKNKRVGFGVFANLDLDALNQRKPSQKSLCQNVPNLESNEKNVHPITKLSDDVADKEASKSDDIYGPELPPNFSSSPVLISSSSKVSPRKHSKHKSKHKHHKNKKKKKKKSSRKDSSDSDSLDELDDIPPSLIIEKMKKLQKKKH